MTQLYWLTFYKIKLMLKSRVLLVVTLLMPLLFTGLLGGLSDYSSQNLIPVVIVDQDHSEYSQLVVKRLSQKPGLKVILTNQATAEKLVKNFQAEVAFVIKKGFQQAVMKEKVEQAILLIKSPLSLSYGIIQEMLAGEVLRLWSNAAAANWVVQEYQDFNLHTSQPDGALWQRAWQATDAKWEPKPLVQLEYQELVGAGPPIKVERIGTVAGSVTTGITVMLLMAIGLFYSGWIVEERNNGTLQRMQAIQGLANPLLAHLLATILTGLAQLGLLVALTKIFYHNQFLSAGYQYLLLAAYLFNIAALGLLFSVLCKTTAQLQSSIPLLTLSSSFLGGCFWSYLDPPKTLQLLALFTPQGWVLKGLEAAKRGEVTLPQVLLPSMVLLCSGVVMGLLAYWRVRIDYPSTKW